MTYIVKAKGVQKHFNNLVSARAYGIRLHNIGFNPVIRNEMTHKVIVSFDDEEVM